MPTLSIIDRYITREIFFVFAGIVVILTLVLMGGSLVRLLQLAAGGDIGKDVVFTLFGLEILRLTGRLVPPAFFFATLFVLGRMYRDNEMTVLSTSGVSPGRLFRLVFLLAVPVSLVTAWLTVFMYPSITYLTTRIKLEQQDAVIVAAMDAGRFIESGKGDIVVYAESRGDDPGTLRNIFVQQREGHKVAIASAASGHHDVDVETGLRTITLVDGMRYERAWDHESTQTLLDFGEYSMWINPSSTERLRRKYTVWSPAALWQEDTLGARAELQGRLSYPLSTLAFVLLAVPLSRSLPRQGIHGRIVMAMILYLVFTGLTEVAATWMEKSITPSWMGTWWVIALMAVVGAVLSLQQLNPGRTRHRRVQPA